HKKRECAYVWADTPEPVEQPLCCDQIGGAETLREAVIDRPQAGDGTSRATLIAQQAGEAPPHPHLPPPRPVLGCTVQRLPEEVLRRFRGGRRALQQQKPRRRNNSGLEPATS